MSKKWYVVHTYSGLEKKARTDMQERIRAGNLQEFFGEIMIPQEKTEPAKGSKQESGRARNFFPGYILVNMELNDRTKSLVKNTPRVTGFVGGDPLNPTPVSDAEIARITSQMEQGVQAPKARVQFSIGDAVRVIDGPFANFNGSVEEVVADKAKVRVQISIFGRATPVTLDFGQVEKT